MNIYTPLTISLLFIFCTSKTPEKKRFTVSTKVENQQKHKNFNTYWYAGKAEITSYKLTQARYGQIYEGTVVNIFVTEDFLPEKQVKADYQNKKNVPILKLNSTKKYTTGIYPYSLMTSTFSPINTNEKAIKISFSAQEWCGNTFIQLNNKEDFKIDFFSYFESNSDREISLEKDILENELWNQLRINPLAIKTGSYKVIPSFEFLGLNHQEIKAYEALIKITKKEDFIYFSISYPTLKRKLAIQLDKEFPYTINSWEETFTQRGKELTTKATKIKTIQSTYWNKNGVTDKKERQELGL